MSLSPKTAKACVICHQKKVKCDLSTGVQPCTNCRVGQYTCAPHQRKRKRFQTDTTQQNPEYKRHEADSNPHPTPTLTANEPVATITPSPHAHLGSSSHLSIINTPVTEQSYVGRGEYIGGQVPFSEEMARGSCPPSPKPALPDTVAQVLRLQHCFELPARSIRASLVDAFMHWCHPWMPIVERSWLQDSDNLSFLLVQSVFVAGSRVSNSPLIHTPTKDFYDRAKTLFFHGHESNVILSIVASCLLQWWNPTAPEKISTDTSGFWQRISVGLAYQIGLHLEPKDGLHKAFRRRLWWSMVIRDNIISIGVGRPRAINLDDSTVRSPTVQDFPAADTKAHLFVAHVASCRCMGDIAESHRRRTLSDDRRQGFENSLLRWVKGLDPSLRLYQRQQPGLLATYDFETRQLHVPYFFSLMMLYRDSSMQSPESTTALIASSFVIGIFEDFVSRDELRYLGPVFAFYALAAGLIQLTGFRYPGLHAIAEHEFNITQLALQQLTQRWGSAEGALRALTRAKEIIQKQPQLEGRPPPLSSGHLLFLEDFGEDICRLWHLRTEEGTVLSGLTGNQDSMPQTQSHTAERLQDIPPPNDPTVMPSVFESASGPSGQDLSLFDTSLPTLGSWFFDDLDLSSGFDFG